MTHPTPYNDDHLPALDPSLSLAALRARSMESARQLSDLEHAERTAPPAPTPVCNCSACSPGDGLRKPWIPAPARPFVSTRLRLAAVPQSDGLAPIVTFDRYRLTPSGWVRLVQLDAPALSAPAGRTGLPRWEPTAHLPMSAEDRARLAVAALASTSSRPTDADPHAIPPAWSALERARTAPGYLAVGNTPDDGLGCCQWCAEDHGPSDWCGNVPTFSRLADNEGNVYELPELTKPDRLRTSRGARSVNARQSTWTGPSWLEPAPGERPVTPDASDLARWRWLRWAGAPWAHAVGEPIPLTVKGTRRLRAEKRTTADPFDQSPVPSMPEQRKRERPTLADRLASWQERAGV